MIRLIASDLDGTIINEHNACDPSVAEAIAHYRNCGVRFAVCSGRPIDSLTPLLEGWGLADQAGYIIGSNGGEVLETATGKRQSAYKLEPEVLRDIIDIYEPMGLISTLYDGTTLYVSRRTPGTDVVADRIGVQCIEADVRAMTVNPELKVMFIVEPSHMEEAERYAASHPDPRINAFRTAPDLLEFSHPLLAKDVGIRIIGAMMHITEDEIMAFGDTTNDIAMLEYVKYGVAMENGTDDAKQAAWGSAPSVNEQGFARFLKAHLTDNLEVIE
jgi:Cof subfamily protein (haloacid dehalogenase superfamily)